MPDEQCFMVLCPRQHSMGDGFYRSKDPTNSIKVLKEMPDVSLNNSIEGVGSRRREGAMRPELLS